MVHINSEYRTYPVVRLSDIRKICDIFEQQDRDVQILASCSDDITRDFKTFEELSAYENSHNSEIRSLYVMSRPVSYGESDGGIRRAWIQFRSDGTISIEINCCCLAIPSMLTAERKCPHDGACEIDAARTGKTSGTQQLTGRVYDNRAGSYLDGSEHTPHQAHTGGIRRGRSSRNSSRQQRSQPCQCYTEHTGDRSSTSGSDQIRRSQPHAPERVAEGARGYRHRSRHVTQDTD